MADEAQVNCSLRIRKISGSVILLDHPHNRSFRATVVGTKGPTPGALTVDLDGESIAFAELTTPGLCWIENNDGVNRIEWGIMDSGIFHPVGEVLPGEAYPIRLSRNLGEEHTEPGTGTTGPVNTFYVKAYGAPVNCGVHAYEA